MATTVGMILTFVLLIVYGDRFVKALSIISKEREESQINYNFSELDQEIADKEKELQALKEVKEKERRLRELDKQIKEVTKQSQGLGFSTSDIVKSKTNNSLMSAEEARNLQETAHWSDNDELMQAYEESFRKVLKDIDKEINKYLITNAKKVIITIEDRVSTNNYPIFNYSNSIEGNAAILEFFENLINHLIQLGYEVDYQEMCFKDCLIITW